MPSCGERSVRRCLRAETAGARSSTSGSTGRSSSHGTARRPSTRPEQRRSIRCGSNTARASRSVRRGDDPRSRRSVGRTVRLGLDNPSSQTARGRVRDGARLRRRDGRDVELLFPDGSRTSGAGDRSAGARQARAAAATRAVGDRRNRRPWRRRRVEWTGTHAVDPIMLELLRADR